MPFSNSVVTVIGMCSNLVDENHIKCPQCRRFTPVSAGRISVNEDLQTDHDLMALLLNFPHSAVTTQPQPSTSRSAELPGGSGAMSLYDAVTEVPTSEASSSDTSTSEKIRKSRKKNKTKKPKKRSKRARSSSSETSSSSESSASDSSSEEEKFKKKRKAFKKKRHSCVKSELDALMRTSKSAIFNKQKKEVKRFYICTKAQGVSRNLTIQHYSTPSAPVLKRLSGKLVVLVPLKASLPYESSDEGVDCDVCQQTVPIRQWAHHIDRCTEQAFRTTKRKTY
ncbi:uncharacterized protein LOC116935506 [Daphnia magna]|uniref:uncharacterized protein LOC116935506 n=1 Tax=Daphnia magna TaxID=35525 RepID=UPI001E1BC444|nr:uncharacterized protein LOC116935506 [Daphnia magna]